MAIKWVMGLIVRDGRILLAKLKHKNDLIVRLQWTFPFTKINDEESPRIAIQRLFSSMKMNVKTGKFLIKYIPSENPKIEEYFYTVKHIKGNPVQSDEYSEFVWIKPTQVLKYLTTSVSKDVMDYLRVLEKTGKELIIE